MDAHRVIRWASTTGHQGALVQELFERYFEQGQDISDHDVLLEVAEKVGMERALAERKQGALAKQAADLNSIVRKKEDTDLRKLTTRKLQELALSDTVKAWSFVSWMMETDREGTLRFLTALGAAENGTTALEEHFGKSAEAVDEEWRLWVRTSH